MVHFVSANLINHQDFYWRKSEMSIFHLDTSYIVYQIFIRAVQRFSTAEKYEGIILTISNLNEALLPPTSYHKIVRHINLDPTA